MNEKPKNNIVELNSYRETVQEIMKMSLKYFDDVAEFYKMDFEEYYRAICSVPYADDENNSFPRELSGNDKNLERVWRPKWILEKLNAADCKKKSILIAAYCIGQNIPVRFVVMSNRADQEPHHIYTEIHNGEKWIVADATYPENKLGKKEKETFREVFEYEYNN